MGREMLPRNIWTNLDIPSDRVLDKDAVRVQKALLDFGIEVPQALQVNQTVTTVYHALTQSSRDFLPRYRYSSFGGVFRDESITKVADSFFNSGFRDIDTSDEFGLTPLEFHCLHWDSLIDGLAFISWLSAKGVSLHRRSTGLDRSKLVSGVTGLHM